VYVLNPQCDMSCRTCAAFGIPRVQDVRPMIETLLLEKAPEAFARMMDRKVRFRMVLVNGKD